MYLQIYFGYFGEIEFSRGFEDILKDLLEVFGSAYQGFDFLFQQAIDSYKNADLLGAIVNLQYLALFNVGHSWSELGQLWQRIPENETFCRFGDSAVCSLASYYLDYVLNNNVSSTFEIAKILYKGSDLLPTNL